MKPLETFFFLDSVYTVIVYFLNRTTMKSNYIDAFILVIPKDKVEKYKKMAQDGCEMWMKHGALSYRECMGNDLTPNME